MLGREIRNSQKSCTVPVYVPSVDRTKQEKNDQPEELAAKEQQQVEDVAMDQGPQDASLTKARMDEMLMDQVMAVSCGTSRVCVNEEKHEPATIRGLPADLVK